MNTEPFEQDVDSLLADLHRMIDEAPADAPTDPLTVEDLDLDFVNFHTTSEPDPGPDILPMSRPVPKPQPPKPQPAYWTQTQKLPRHVAKLQKNQEKAYADWLYEQDGNQPITPPPLERKPKQKSAVTYEELPDYDPEPPKPKKKRHGFRNFVLILLILACFLTAVVVFLLPRQPKASHATLTDRKEGVSTVLLAGTDESSARTDTLMLLTIDRPQRSISLVSIPRDTLVNGSYAVPKINSVYGANDGGEVGMDMLLTRVSECIGFRPDGCLILRLDAFVELVDALGGVTFDVPVDMYYNDPAQDLHIDLVAGTQTLTGEEAMGVVRFRSGYADADLGRVQVQRDFLSALIKQAVSVEGIAKSPLLLQILMEHTDSNLTASNYLWMAESLLLMDLSQIQTVTLPGTPRTISGGSYYVLDPESVAQTVNTYCNPYETEITASNLTIRSN